MTDITRKRGDTYAEEIVVVDANGAAIDITGYTFRMTVDPSRFPDTAANNLFTISGTITDAASGAVEFAPTALQADQTPGVYWYDVEMTDTLGRIKTIVTGKFVFEQDISK